MKINNALGCLASTLLLFPSSILAAAPDSGSAAAASVSQKTHTLYMGTDVSVEVGPKLYHISDVNGTSFVITVDGQKTLVPMHGEPHSLKVVPSLKLTQTSATVAGFTCERAYTPRSDPQFRRMLSANETTAALGDSASLAEGKYVTQLRNENLAAMPTTGSDGKLTPGSNLITEQQSAANAQPYIDSINRVQAQMESGLAGGAYGEIQASNDLLKEQFDAVEVNFTVSSTVSLEKPYLFLIVNYREHDAKPESTRKLIYAKALDPIGPTPEKIHIMQGGLPPGYTLESYQLHLYDSGREIATDVAPKRVLLTRDDAFQYVMIDYLTKNKGATRSASPALGKPDSKVAASLTYPQLTGVYYVKVSKDGMPLEAFTDQVCTVPVDAGIGSIVKNVRFYPALSNGKPVEGVARLVLNQLAI